MVEGYYTVNYVSMIPILTKAIQEQQLQISELQDQLTIQNEIDLSNATISRIVASEHGRLNAGIVYNADPDSKAYMIGVLESDLNGTAKVQTDGVVSIEVDSSSGIISVGDFVTASSDGLAKKSLESEWVIGVAVSNQNNTSVEVRIDIRYKQ